MSDQQPKVCSICGESFQGYGNNAFPVNTGRCCDACNNVVLRARINNVIRNKAPGAYPEWFNQDLLKELQLFLEKKTRKRKEESIREISQEPVKQKVPRAVPRETNLST